MLLYGHVCVRALLFQKCHKQLFLPWALGSRPPPRTGGERGCGGERRALPAGPSEELCLGWGVMTGSLAYESLAKLARFLWGKM